MGGRTESLGLLVELCPPVYYSPTPDRSLLLVMGVSRKGVLLTVLHWHREIECPQPEWYSTYIQKDEIKDFRKELVPSCATESKSGTPF